VLRLEVVKELYLVAVKDLSMVVAMAKYLERKKVVEMD
jgi:hypothetical protein